LIASLFSVAAIDIVNQLPNSTKVPNSRRILPECKVKKGKKPKLAT